MIFQHERIAELDAKIAELEGEVQHLYEENERLASFVEDDKLELEAKVEELEAKVEELEGEVQQLYEENERLESFAEDETKLEIAVKKPISCLKAYLPPEDVYKESQEEFRVWRAIDNVLFEMD
jgi:outer membrane murein-binding lipoprotein Lpp